MSTVDGVTFNNTGASLPNTRIQTVTVDEETLTIDEVIYNNLWELSNTQNQPLADGDQKTRFFYRHMRKEFIRLEKNIDRKKADEKDTWTDIYQLIGFFSVFQGVWFQGVTQLVAQRTCRFFIIPVILSVLVSVATLVGCFVKFARVRNLQVGFYKDKLQSKVLESRLSGFGRYGLKFNLKTFDESLEGSIAALTTLFEEQLVEAHQIKIIVLAGLTIFSGLFAWLIYAVMCDEFP